MRLSFVLFLTVIASAINRRDYEEVRRCEDEILRKETSSILQLTNTELSRQMSGFIATYCQKTMANQAVQINCMPVADFFLLSYKDPYREKYDPANAHIRVSITVLAANANVMPVAPALPVAPRYDYGQVQKCLADYPWLKPK